MTREFEFFFKNKQKNNPPRIIREISSKYGNRIVRMCEPTFLCLINTCWCTCSGLVLQLCNSRSNGQ